MLIPITTSYHRFSYIAIIRGIARLTLMVGHTFYDITCIPIAIANGSYVHLFMGVLKSAKYE